MEERERLVRLGIVCGPQTLQRKGGSLELALYVFVEDWLLTKIDLN